MENKFKKILPFALLAAAVGVFYSRLFNGFFQQDEWYSYGYFLAHRNLDFLNFVKFVFAPNVTHYNPITVFIEYVLFHAWGMDYIKFMVIGLISHVLAVFSVYLLSKRIFKDVVLSFLTALLFGLFAAPYQGAAWVIVDIATLWASILGVLSTLFFLDFLDKKRQKYFIVSIVFLVISLFVKEIAIGLFPMFFLTWFFYGGKKKEIKNLVLLVVIACVYFLFRIGMAVTNPGAGGGLVTQSQSFNYLIYNFFTVPLKVLSQTLIPYDVFKMISLYVSRFFPTNVSGRPGTTKFEIFAIHNVMETISIGLSLLIIVSIIIFTIKLWKKNKEWLLVIASLLWIVLNSFIFSFAPETSGVINIVDSRNLYFTAIGVAFLIILLTKIYVRKNDFKFLIIFIPVVILNIFWLNSYLSNFVELGRVRRVILQQISTDNPHLPQKVIFYTDSNKEYYGLAEKIMPFQSGFGQTLLAWYNRRQDFPSVFFKNRYLWDIRSQGYQEVDGVGFGYFRDINLLREAIIQNKLSIDNLVAYRFNAGSNSLVNITSEIRVELAQNGKTKK